MIWHLAIESVLALLAGWFLSDAQIWRARATITRKFAEDLESEISRFRREAQALLAESQPPESGRRRRSNPPESGLKKRSKLSPRVGKAVDDLIAERERMEDSRRRDCSQLGSEEPYQ
jgi:hypothetical protein